MKQHDQARCRSYGGPAGDDTHGSGRFASDRETRPFVQGGDGLLIGRDRKSGKPLRTGKGVGTIIPNPLARIDPVGLDLADDAM